MVRAIILSIHESIDFGDSPMIRASYPTIDAPASATASAVSGRASRRIGRIFALILDALHRSRRLQAQRVLHQYRHLIARAPASKVHHPEANEGRS
jgi:hypothetical protein